MSWLYILQLICISAIFWHSGLCATSTQVKTLYGVLLTNYDVRIRPRIVQSDAVNVSSQFVPNNIIEFDTTEQKFAILGYMRVSWNDESLRWTPSDHGNTESVKIPLKQIWKPSLILSKAFDGDGLIGESMTDIASVDYNGEVQWVPEGILSFVCEVDIQFYPFDEQVCTLTYYVSDETATTVALHHLSDVTLAEYIANSEWDLVQIKRDSVKMYGAFFIDIHFVVQRRANFTTFTIIVPLLMLAFLNICVFLVPIDSGEKGSFSITIFLSYGIFVTIVSDTLPHNSLQVSYFVLFLIVLLMLSVLSVFYTIIQAKLVAAIGDNEFTLKKYLCCFKKKEEKNKVHPMGKDGIDWKLEEYTKDSLVGAVGNQGETGYVDGQGNVVIIPSDEKKVSLDPTRPKSVKSPNGGMAKPTTKTTAKLAREKTSTSMASTSSASSSSPTDDKIDIEDDDDNKEDDIFTWRMFFERLDTFLFVLFFIVIVIASTVFFCLMMQRLGVDTFKNVI